MQKHSYHKTTNIPAQLVFQFETVARTQEVMVLEYFQNNPGVQLTRDEMHTALGLTCKPDSIGRAMTNLKNAGKLRLLKDVRRMGSWGHVQHAYKLICEV